jgi:hypothetical protein
MTLRFVVAATLSLIGNLTGIIPAELLVADTSSLFDILPESTAAAVGTDNFNNAWRYREANRTPDAVKRGDWSDAFAISSATLAAHLDGGLIRASVSLKSQSTGKTTHHDLVIAEVKNAEAISAILATARKRTLAGGVWRLAEVADPDAKLHVFQPGSSARKPIVHCVYRDHLIMSNQFDIASQVVRQLNNRPPAGSNSAWAAIRPRLNTAAASYQTQLFWYADPWNMPGSDASIAHTLKSTSSKSKPSKDTDADGMTYQTAKRHGLDGIQVLGGAVGVETIGTLVGQTFIHAPKPWRSTLRILDLTSTESLPLPAWVPANVEGATILHGDMAQAASFIGPLFDDMLAEGVAGTFDDVLEDLKDPDGLNVDLKRALFAHFGPRAVLLTGKLKSGEKEGTAAPILLALEIAATNGASARVAETIDLLMTDDPEAKRVVIKDCSVWQIAAPEGARSSVVGVARGYFFLADDVELLRDILLAAPASSLSHDPEVSAALQLIFERTAKKPSVTMVGGATTHTPGARRDNSSGWLAPWDGLFQGSWGPEPTTSLWSRNSVVGGHRVIVGFVEVDGWLFTTATAK